MDLAASVNFVHSVHEVHSSASYPTLSGQVPAERRATNRLTVA